MLPTVGTSGYVEGASPAVPDPGATLPFITIKNKYLLFDSFLFLAGIATIPPKVRMQRGREHAGSPDQRIKPTAKARP
jgi:hypothetical protein